MWIDLLFALVIAGVLSALLFMPLGWRHPRAPEAAAPAAIFMFLILFLAVWAAAVWIPPVGPLAWGVGWMVLIIVGVLVALLLVAASPPPRPRTPAEAVAEAEAEATAARAADVVFGVFFWILIVALIIAIILAYV